MSTIMLIDSTSFIWSFYLFYFKQLSPTGKQDNWLTRELKSAVWPPTISTFKIARRTNNEVIIYEQDPFPHLEKNHQLTYLPLFHWMTLAHSVAGVIILMLFSCPFPLAFYLLWGKTKSMGALLLILVKPWSTLLFVCDNHPSHEALQ